MDTTSVALRPVNTRHVPVMNTVVVARHPVTMTNTPVTIVVTDLRHPVALAVGHPSMIRTHLLVEATTTVIRTLPRHPDVPTTILMLPMDTDDRGSEALLQEDMADTKSGLVTGDCSSLSLAHFELLQGDTSEDGILPMT